MKKFMIMLMSVATVCGFGADKKIAVFVQNKSGIPALDAQTDGIRERIAAAFAEVEGFQIVDRSRSRAPADAP